ncbi:hypothetical protein [Inediibacterium massiliense]|uniref:hypothetical protein n=1 Tax=Inediibacterium massiliense TaxID=1658111 RepID=UPI0006B4D220|nr:hypothetical protein [Inediibacterium massiliense]
MAIIKTFNSGSSPGEIAIYSNKKFEEYIDSYVSFNVDTSTFGGRNVKSAKIKLFCTSATKYQEGMENSARLRAYDRKETTMLSSEIVVDDSYINHYIDIPLNENFKVDDTYFVLKHGVTSYFSSAKFMGFGSQSSPILEIELESIAQTKPTNLKNSSDKIYDTIKLSWDYEKGAEQDHQTKFDLMYSVNGGIWKTITESTENNFKEFAPFTFKSKDSIVWKVRTYSIDNAVSEWSDEVHFTLQEYTPPYPTNLMPGGSIEKDHDITFSWQYQIPVTGFELKYSNDGSTFKTISKNTADTTADTSLTIPKSEFETGTVFWQIRCKDKQGIWSNWTNITTFIYAGKPKTPQIISTNHFNVAYIKVEWVSNEQVAYEFKILDGSTEVVSTNEVTSSTQKNYEYTSANNKTLNVQIRIKNQFGLWSDWDIQTISVNFELPTTPQVFVNSNEKRGSVEIKVINMNIGIDIKENQVMRRKINEDWNIIGTISKNKTYIDYTIISDEVYEYKIRAIGINGGVIDSDSNIAKVKVRNTQLANTEDYTDYVELKYNPKRTLTYSLDEHLTHFVGRKKAVVERGEFEDTSLALSFTIREYNNLMKLINLIKSGETLLLRDSRKRKIYCSIDNLQIQEDWQRNKYNVSFSVNEVDFEEVI